MKLMLVDDNGICTTVTDCLEEYNLEKKLAQSELIEEIKEAIRSALAYGDKR